MSQYTVAITVPAEEATSIFFFRLKFTWCYSTDASFFRFEAVHPYFIFRHDVSEKVIPFKFKPHQMFRRGALVILLALIIQLPLVFPCSPSAPIFCTHLLPNCPVGTIIVSQLRAHLP
jgi:hypothetical protein